MNATALAIRDHILRIADWYNVYALENGYYTLDDVYEVVSEKEREISQWISTFFPGWNLLGCGGYRLVLLSPSGFAVKVNIEDGGNEMEINTYNYIVTNWKDAFELSVRPAKTSCETINGECVVIQEAIFGESLWDTGMPKYDGDHWLNNMSDAPMQGAMRDGVAYIWDLQF